MFRKLLILAALGAMLLSAGCGAAPEPANPTAQTAPALTQTTSAASGSDIRFTPYTSATPRASTTPTPPGTATPLPTPSPTPRQHTVARGEDMGGIAYRYGISLETLIAANPNVNPSAMSIGTVLMIPGSANPAPGSPTGVPTLTPMPLETGPVNCAATSEGGAWCFLLLRNTGSAALENLAGVIRLADAASGQILSQTALPPLDLLPAGASLPLAAYFPAPVPAQFTAGGELLTAMPVSGQNRYLPTVLDAQPAEIAAGGQTARVHGTLRLADAAGTAQQVWVAAVAYDSRGQVVGTRRWQAQSTLAAGEEAAFDFAVYSTGAVIQRVELLAQARP